MIHYCLDLSVRRACDHARENVSHFLCDQSVLKRATGGVVVIFVVKRDRAQRHEPGAVRVHVRDVVFVAAGRRQHAQLAAIGNKGAAGRQTDDAGKKDPRLRAADSNRAGLISGTATANIDIVVTRDETPSRVCAHGDIVIRDGGGGSCAGTGTCCDEDGADIAVGGANRDEVRVTAALYCVAGTDHKSARRVHPSGIVQGTLAYARAVASKHILIERQSTIGRVVAAGRVQQQRDAAGCGIRIARCIDRERADAACGVVGAGGVAEHRGLADGGVAYPGRVAAKRIPAVGGIVAAAGIVPERERAAGGVLRAKEIILQRKRAARGIVIAAEIGEKRLHAVRGVVVARNVFLQSVHASRGVHVAGCVALQRKCAGGGVRQSARIGRECRSSVGRVLVAARKTSERPEAAAGVVLPGQVEIARQFADECIAGAVVVNETVAVFHNIAHTRPRRICENNIAGRGQVCCRYRAAGFEAHRAIGVGHRREGLAWRHFRICIHLNAEPIRHIEGECDRRRRQCAQHGVEGTVGDVDRHLCFAPECRRDAAGLVVNPKRHRHCTVDWRAARVGQCALVVDGLRRSGEGWRRHRHP